MVRKIGCDVKRFCEYRGLPRRNHNLRGRWGCEQAGLMGMGGEEGASRAESGQFSGA
jgi:hypothetical protein